jgi:hypothetical protein
VEGAASGPVFAGLAQLHPSSFHQALDRNLIF